LSLLNSFVNDRKNETKETDENFPDKNKLTKYISFDKPKQCLNFEEFNIDSYLNTLKGK